MEEHRHTIILSLTIDPWHLNIGGTEILPELAVAMLRQALDFMEREIQFREMDNRARQMAAAVQRQTENQMIVSKLRQ